MFPEAYILQHCHERTCGEPEERIELAPYCFGLCHFLVEVFIHHILKDTSHTHYIAAFFMRLRCLALIMCFRNVAFWSPRDFASAFDRHQAVDLYLGG